MKLKLVIIASAFVVLAASGSRAADISSYEEPVPPVSAPVFGWGGGYIGGQIGYGWGKSRFDGDLEVKPDGFLGGIYAGYNFAMSSNVVLGVDGDITYYDLDDDYTENAFTLGSSLRWAGALRARLGYAVDRVLPYIAGGVAFGNVEQSLSTPSLDATHSKTLTGWTAGAGIDYAATDNVILRLEYRYTDLGNADYNFGLPNADFENKFQTNEIRLGIAYKF